MCHRTPRSTLGLVGCSRLRFEALPRSREDQPRARAISSAQRPHCQGIPLGPFEVATHTPFPSLPCLRKLSGLSRLSTFHTYLGLNCLRRLLPGIPGHWRLSLLPPAGSLASLACVSHVPPQFLRARVVPFPYSSPSPPPQRQSQAPRRWGPQTEQLRPPRVACSPVAGRDQGEKRCSGQGVGPFCPLEQE